MPDAQPADDARARDDVPAAYRWDTTALYDSVEDWEAACEAYADAIDDFSVPDSIATDPDALLDALQGRDHLEELGSRLHVYANLRAFEDVTDDDAQARVRRVKALNADRDAAVKRLESRLREADRAAVESLLANHDCLGTYDHYVDDVYRRAAYALDPAADDALAALEESLDAPARTLRTLADRTFDPPTVGGPDGEDVRLTRQRRNDALTHPDRAYRRRVYEAYRETLADHREVAAQAYTDHLRRHAAEASLRGYETTADESLAAAVPADVRETLTDGILANNEAFCRPYAHRRDRIGVDRLRPWDLRAPLSDASGPPEIPYERAVEAVVEAVAPLGEAYQQRLGEFLDGRRVDVRSTEHKRQIPAVMFGSDGTDAFVHLNYGADLESLFLFAHELGHAMHYELAREAQPAPYQRISWYGGELPSFLHEILLVRHLLDTDWVPDGAVLDAAVGRLSPLLAARGAAFTHRVVADVEADESLAADDLDRHFRETGEAFFDHVEFTETDGHRWQALNLDRNPFHAYYYVIGRTAALATASHLRDGDLSPADYRAFLRAGDSDYSMDLLASLGVDLSSMGTVKTASEEYGRLVDGLVE
jgi:oligoendopeptidase F